MDLILPKVRSPVNSPVHEEYQDFLFDSTAAVNYYAGNMKRADDEGWEYGDVWMQGSPAEPVPDDDVLYVEILRGDTGMGYDDSTLIDFVGYLSSWGIRATYDAVPLAAEFGGAIKTYVLKVEAGKEDEAKELLRKKGSGGK